MHPAMFGRIGCWKWKLGRIPKPPKYETQERLDSLLWPNILSTLEVKAYPKIASIRQTPNPCKRQQSQNRKQPHASMI